MFHTDVCFILNNVSKIVSSAHSAHDHTHDDHHIHATSCFPVWLPLVLAVILVGLDQALKAWALANLSYGTPAIPVIPWILDWQLTFNTGAAWSMFSDSTHILAIGRLLVGLGILGYLLWKPPMRLLTIVLTMIASGALGNAIDGVLNGKVTDMIHAPFLSAITRALNAGDFPIFNIADMCVVMGTLILLVQSFLPENNVKAESESKDESHSIESHGTQGTESDTP